MSGLLQVAVAVITDDKHRVLITQRAAYDSFGGYWEFPGGKLEPLEKPEDALKREILEELGLEVLDYTYIGQLIHGYVDKKVCLSVFHVSRFCGEPALLVNQQGQAWVTADELSNYKLLEASELLVAMLDDVLLTSALF